MYYINGVRKKYMNPFRFLLIILTLAGFSIYFARDITINELDNISETFQGDGMKNFMNKLYDYNSLFTSLLIPFYALISWIVFFNKRKLNYFENIVFYTYSQAFFSSIGILLTFLLFVIPPELSVYMSYLLILLWIVYNTFLSKKIFNLTKTQTFIKLIYFLGIFLVIYVSLMIAFFALMYLLQGPEFFEQFVPKEKPL